MRYLVVPLLFLFAQQCWAEANVAGKNCTNEFGAKLISLQGKLFFDPDSKGHWQPAQLNQTICQGSRVRVEPYSRASLLLPNGIVLRLDAGTVLSLNGLARDKPTLLDLLRGFVYLISRTPRRLEISSPIANAGPEGTEFAMSVDESNASLWVYEGGVRFFNAQGSIKLEPGQSAQARLGQAPQARIDIKPQDAVNWALYYPPLLPYPEASRPIDTDMRKAIRDFRQGRIDDALSQLDAFAPEKRTPYFFKVRGAMRLTVGQVTLALQDIHALLATNPNDAEALALQSVLALTQNRKDEAYTLANRAISSDPRSSPAYSALSYAEQGRFELDKALKAADQATKYSPQDAMVWARKAELELAQRLTSESKKTAQHALKLDATLERTQTVMGFAYLLRIDIDEALQAFEKAVNLDSTSPLARLGLGLAKIRKGGLEEGRQDLEIAAILDPYNSLIRSYLGKAYYEEKRSVLAEDQYSLAKQHDPKDPTPHFYDAINKQTTNRPVEALHDMQKAIELNNYRGVYRSKLLLDEDLAARGASFGRIYNDLGFQWLGLVEGWKSVNTDPSNFSAHRLLADNYSVLPRHETARVSELLQSQLLQPANMTPTQPHLAESNLLLLDGLGPATQSFNEFNPLYTRNRLSLQASGLFGANGTWGNEVVQSGLWDRFSYSLGQFHYESNGFRENNQVETDLYTGFAQYAITPNISTQFEFRDSNINAGDLAYRFNPDDFNKNLKRETHTRTLRPGFHYKVNENSDVITSLSFQEREITEKDFSGDYIDDNGFLRNDKTTSEVATKAYQVETQYLLRLQNANMALGFGYLDQDESRTAIFDNKTFFDGECIECTLIREDKDRGGKFINSYLYSNIDILKNLIATLGVSFDSMDSRSLGQLDKVNPKVGLTWKYLPSSAFRAAYFTTVKRPSISNQTVEPTQVAGFNQFFDDLTGAITQRYGMAIDHKFSNNISGGNEISWRNLKIPVSNFPSKNQREHLDRAYLYWTPTDNIALNLEVNYERIHREPLFGSDMLPTDIQTLRLPLSINYFFSSGFFSKITATYINQTVEKQKNVVDQGQAFQGSDQFWTVDSQLGFRLPKRWGIISIGVKNLFNEKFNFEDLNFLRDTSSQVTPLFQPRRFLYSQITLSF